MTIEVLVVEAGGNPVEIVLHKTYERERSNPDSRIALIICSATKIVYRDKLEREGEKGRVAA